MQPARFWHTENTAIRCDLCPHRCLIKEGKAGICKVRINHENQLYSLSYAHPLAVNIDPIEKKPLYHFYPGEKALSVGTAGCNLQCRFCQNWQLSQRNYQHIESEDLLPTDIVEAARVHHCKIIAYTYNEPTVFAEYVLETSQLAHEAGLSNIMVTNGYISKEAFTDVYQYIDAANVDLKFFSDTTYKEMTGGYLKPVLETLIQLKNHHVWTEITTLIIPGKNDSEEEFREMISWVLENLGPDVPLHLSAYHPDYHFTESPATSPVLLKKLRQSAMSSGMHYVYTGNIWDEDGSTTYCPACGKKIIVRTGMRTTRMLLNQSHCGCGLKIAGIF